jgi:hypothetical protein
MAEKTASVAEESAVPSECCHHWLIEGGTTPTSKGVCKLCGQEKQFKNSYKSGASGDKTQASEQGRPKRRRSRKNEPREEDVLLRIERLFAMVSGMGEKQSGDRL